MIIWILREKGKNQHEFLFIHSILHRVHEIVPVIKHKVSETLLPATNGHLKH
jgi:hypothetical protein